jgi:amidase
MELVDGAVARIEAHDSRINAVVVRDIERARGPGSRRASPAARNTDHGKGVLQRRGSANHVGPADGSGLAAHRGCGRRLKAAGALVLGKTNIAAAIADWQSFNAVYGTTNNPWDVNRTPGGSSGGSAAALAAGYVPLELGSDISGSLGVPAHFCGVFSHRPSSGLVPQRGHAPPRSESLPTDLTSGLGVCGPMARTAADLAAALDVLAGPDDNLAVAYRLLLPPARHTWDVAPARRSPDRGRGSNGAIERAASRSCGIGTAAYAHGTERGELRQTTRVLSKSPGGSLGIGAR